MCNGKKVTALDGTPVKYWFHPNRRFISVQQLSPEGAPASTIIYCESPVGWQPLEGWYFDKKNLQGETLPDPAFSVLDDSRAKDGNRSYFVGRRASGPLPDAPYLALTFYPIPGNPPVEAVAVMPDPRYCSTAAGVYYIGLLVPDADPATFRVYPLAESTIMRVKLWHRRTEDAFRFACDKQSVYHGNAPVQGAHPRTFDPDLYIENLMDSKEWEKKHERWLHDTGRIVY